MSTARVVFTPSGRQGAVALDSTVLDAARALGVDLDSVCGGRQICGHCQVHVSTGEFAKWSISSDRNALSRPGPEERAARLSRPLGPEARLGCAARIQADVVIDVPAASQVHRPVVRKELRLDELRIDPTVMLAYVELGTAELDSSSEFLGRALVAEIAATHGVTVAVPPAELLTELEAVFSPVPAAGTLILALPRGSRDTTDAAREPARIVGALPGFTDVALGIAVDVGSTTIAAHLCDLTTGEVLATAGVMNPQIRFGEDLMSRVSYVMMNPGGETELTRVVREAINDLVTELIAHSDSDADHVLDLVVVGNPIMHHLVLGLDPTPLGVAPFTLAVDGAVTTTAAAIGIQLPHAGLYCPPCIAGHVGADAAAALLAEGVDRAPTPRLLVDIGTNAEIVLGTPDGIWAASSPTGPAFEGAQISAGQRATAGAIERVRVDPDTLATKVKVIGCDHWSDEPAFDEDAPAVTGICGSGIVEAIAELFLAGVIHADGTIDGAAAARSDRVVAEGRTAAYVLHDDGHMRVVITQNDVRAIQLAKAALRAGIDLVLEEAGNPDVADVRLAGAFGAHIDPLHALVLGLVPDAPVAAVRAVGNAAGAGAARLLFSNA